MLYCLDTNVIIDFFYNEKKIVEKIQELEEQQVQISITPINLCELWRGVYLAPKPEKAKEKVTALLEKIEILAFTETASHFYGEQYSELKKKGRQAQEFDLLIASIVLAHNAVLATRDRNDFEHIKDLKFVVW